MEWSQKTLFKRIQETWDEKKAVYTRLNNARNTIGGVFRPDLGIDIDPSHDMLVLGGDIYEGSGPWVARTASAAFQGNTVSKKIDWLMYKMREFKVKGIDELDKFCQDCKEHMADCYQRGNFYDVQPQYTLNAWTIGSPVMFGEEDMENERLMWIPLHYKTYRLYYNRFNECEGIIIKDEWTVKKIYDKFCKGITAQQRLAQAKKLFSINLQSAIEQGRFSQKFKIWRAVFKRTDAIWDGQWTGKPVNPDMFWWDVYFEDGCSPDKQNSPLESAGYFSKPFVNWDYEKKPWETASRTPAFYAIYDNLSLQQIFKNYLEHLQLKVRPAMAILTEMQGKTKFGPEGEIYLDRSEWKYKPEPIENMGDITLERETADMFSEKLTRHFHLEMFRQFTDLAKSVKRDLKVSEVLEISGERISELLPAIESHESYLSQVDDRAMDVERRAGRGPFNPRDLENVYDIIFNYTGKFTGSKPIEPEFIGTLRQAQQMQQGLKPIQYGVSIASEIAAAMGDPDLVRLVIKGYDTLDEALRAVNFPQKNIRTEEDYNKLSMALEQMRQQDKNFAKLIEAAKASKNLQTPIDKTSVIGQLAGAGTAA